MRDIFLRIIFYFFLGLSVLAWWLDQVKPDVSSDDSWTMAGVEEATIIPEEEPSTLIFKECKFISIEDYIHKTIEN